MTIDVVRFTSRVARIGGAKRTIALVTYALLIALAALASFHHDLVLTPAIIKVRRLPRF
jgi:hypothetical protein